MMTTNPAVKPSLSSQTPSTLKTRFLRAGCYIWGISLDDQPPYDPRIQKMVRIIWFLLLCWVILGFGMSQVAPAVSEFIHGFVDGARYGNFDTSAPAQPDVAITAVGFLVIAMFIIFVMWSKLAFRQAAHNHASDQLKIEREQAARQQAEASLRLLKAQIEPHFLFNTLSSVQHLAEGKAPEAAALTADLIVFLRATLSSLRADHIALSEDLAICDAYLRIMQTRLTHRLSYQITCSPQLEKVRIPSTLLLTLLENAIKHGIEPMPMGGSIAITVLREGDRVNVSVQDSGAGFSDVVGQGLGLQNIRERLALIYGDRAELRLEENTASGVTAQLIFPSGL